MVDIETLSTASNAVILTIGCIPFGPKGETIVEEDMFFYNKIDLNSYTDNKAFHSDFSTLIWWLGQADEPRNEAFLTGPRKPLKQVLSNFATWIKQICDYMGNNKVHMWSHGKDFDCVILANAFKACHMICPWSYYETLDTRTLYSLAGVEMKNIKIPDGYAAHNAIGDCLKQIQGMKQAYDNLN